MQETSDIANKVLADHAEQAVLAGLSERDAATATVTLRDLADRTLPPATRARLGGLLREAGHPQEALTVLREAVISAPEEPELYLELATTQLSLGRHGQAAAVVAKGLMMAPDDARLRSLLAEAGEHAVVAAPPIAPHDSVELASRPPEQTTEAPAGSSAFSGNLRQFSVVEMLEFLRMNRRTGVLRLVSDGRVAEVHLVDGHLAGGTIAGNARLGKMLLTNGMVAPEALQRAVELQRSLPRPLPLGQVLLLLRVLLLPLLHLRHQNHHHYHHRNHPHLRHRHLRHSLLQNLLLRRHQICHLLRQPAMILRFIK